MYQTIIIGGGPSGLMAAVAASEQSSSVLLIEKKKGLGRKLKISGGGRCNVTNRLPYAEIIKNIPGNGKFLYSPFSIFDNESIIDFFESRGVKLKEEDHGRMFPVSNKAQDVVDTLVTTIERQHVTIKEEEAVSRIEVNTDQTFTVHTQNNSYESHSLVIATGGTSVPQTGSTGDGYKFAQDLGHTITELFPTEVPITSAEPFIKSNRLKGLSLKDVELSVLKKNGKKRISHQMDEELKTARTNADVDAVLKRFNVALSDIEAVITEKENSLLRIDNIAQQTYAKFKAIATPEQLAKVKVLIDQYVADGNRMIDEDATLNDIKQHTQFIVDEILAIKLPAEPTKVSPKVIQPAPKVCTPIKKEETHESRKVEKELPNTGSEGMDLPLKEFALITGAALLARRRTKNEKES